MTDERILLVSIASAAGYVWSRDHTLPRYQRLFQAITSAGMGYGAARGGVFVGWNDVLVAVAVTALGPLALDVLSGLVKDRAASVFLAIIKSKFGK